MNNEQHTIIDQSTFLAPDPRTTRARQALPTDPYLRRALYGQQAYKARIPDRAAIERGRIRSANFPFVRLGAARAGRSSSYTSDLTRTKLRLTRGSYPNCGYISSDLVTVMLKQPKKFIPTKVTHIEDNLLRMMSSAYIEIPNPTDPMAEPQFMHGMTVLLEALRAYAYKSPKIVAKYLEHESLLRNPIHKEIFPELRDDYGEWREPTEDEICQYAGIDPSEFLGQCYAALHNYGMEQAKLAVVVAAPEIVRATIASAKISGKEGAADRKLLLEAAKVVEPAGALVNIDQRSVTVNNFPGQNEGLPAWPGLVKNDGAEAKQLVAANSTNIVEGELVSELEYVSR